MTSSLDQAQVLNAAMERKAKQFDKVIGEWKGLAEKEEEFILVKKAQSKALDSMQVALETETKSKAEALRMKKKLEGDAADLGLALEHAIAGNAETQTTIKKYALQVRDAQLKVDEESAAKSAAADAKVTADRRAAAVANGLEEARALLETADRQRRAAEQELADTNETLADLTNVTTADEDRKNHERMQALIDQLQGKVKSYKKQIEEAEEIAALNLAKYRKVAGALGDAEASADANEQAMAMRKARAKSASLGL